MKISNGEIFKYLAEHPTYALIGTGNRTVERSKLVTILEAGRKLGLLRGSEYTQMIQAPSGQTSHEEYGQWVYRTRNTLVKEAMNSRTAMLGPQQAHNRLGETRAGELTDILFEAKGSVRKAYKLSKDRVPVGKKITDVTYTPPIRGRR